VTAGQVRRSVFALLFVLAVIAAAGAAPAHSASAAPERAAGHFVGGAKDVTGAAAAACSAAFKAAWDKARAGKQITFALGPLSSLSASSFQISGLCASDKTFTFSGGAVKLLNGALAATGAKGVVSNTRVCITSAAFASPPAWKLASLTVSTTAPLCAPVNGGSPTGKLHATGTPFYSLPGLTKAGSSITFAPGNVALAYQGALAGAGNALIAATLKADGTFSRNVAINAVQFLGQKLPVSGLISGDRTGIKSSTVKGGVAGPFDVVDGLSASNLRLNLNLQAFAVTADTALGVTNKVATRVAGSVANLNNWSLPLTTPSPASWTPITGLTLQPRLVGTLASANGAITFHAKASAGEASPAAALAVWKPRPGVEVQVQSVEVGNTKPPAECTQVDSGHPWLEFTGPGSVAILGSKRPASAVGCADLESRVFDVLLTANQTSLVLQPGLTFKSSSLRLVGDTKTGVKNLTGIGSMAGTVAGKPVNVNAVWFLLDDGTLVVGGNANALVAGWVPSAVGGILYFSTGEVEDFDTQNAALGTIDLPAGISLAFTYVIDETTSNQLKTAFSHLGLPAAPAGKFVAQATLDANGLEFELKILLELTNPKPLFSTCPDGKATCDKTQATSLTPHSAYLQISTDKTFTLGVDAFLHLPPMIPGGSDSTLETHAELQFDLKKLTGQLAIFYKGAWVDAFAIKGLTLTKLGIQGGLSFKTAVPVPSIGFIATATHLPDDWAKALGYVQGGPLTVGLNISVTNPIVHIEFGTKGGNSVVLRPLAQYGQAVANDLEIKFAQLVIAPLGGNLGGEDYDDGVWFAFDGTVVGFAVNAAGSFTTDPAGFTIDLDIPSITLPNTSIVLGNGPNGTHLHIAVNEISFAIEFSGGLKFSGFDFHTTLSLKTTGSFALDASLTTKGTFLTDVNLNGRFNPASGDFSMTGTGKISVTGASANASVTVNLSGVKVSFDVATPIGSAHFSGQIDSGGFALSTTVNFDVSGSGQIDGIARVGGSVHVGGSAAISSNSGFSVSVSASFKGNGCFYNVFTGAYDVGCIDIDLGSGSVGIASDLKSISFSAVGRDWSIPLV
jgi:hypothetical protein